MWATDRRPAAGPGRDRLGPVGRLRLGPGAAPDSRRSAALRLAAALTFTFPFQAAVAAELVPPDPWQVIHTAREFGPAEVARDGMGDPQIQGTTDGLPYRVTFYGCTLGRDCDTILFDARFSRKEWDEKQPDAKLFDAWNREKLFGRAWRDDEGRAVLDHPVALGPGIPTETLAATFERWRAALTEYAGHIGVR